MVADLHDGRFGFVSWTKRRFHEPERDCTLYRPGAFQDYQIEPITGKWDLLYAHFLPRADWFAWLGWPEEGPGFMVLRLDDPGLRRRVRLRLREMIQLNNSSYPRAQILGQNALEEALLWFDSVNPELRASQIDPRVRKAMEYLGGNLSRPFSEAELARAGGLSPSRLRHLFHRETGTSPRNYLEGQRMRRAEELLVFSRQTIAEIAGELGFENPFYFTLRFKKHAGESPRSYRQRRLERS